MNLDSEEIKNALTLLEEVISSNIFDAKKINNINTMYGGKTFTDSQVTDTSVTDTSATDTQETETSEQSSITGDSMTIGHISVPSDIFKVRKKEDSCSNSNNSSNYNLAFSNYSCGKFSDFEKILDYKFEK